MQYVAIVTRALILIIGIYMLVKNPLWSPPSLSGMAFILIALSLCLNRIMAVKKTPCLMKCFNKKKEK